MCPEFPVVKLLSW